MPPLWAAYKVLLIVMQILLGLHAAIAACCMTTMLLAAIVAGCMPNAQIYLLLKPLNCYKHIMSLHFEGNCDPFEHIKLVSFWATLCISSSLYFHKHTLHGLLKVWRYFKVTEVVWCKCFGLSISSACLFYASNQETYLLPDGRLSV